MTDKNSSDDGKANPKFTDGGAMKEVRRKSFSSADDPNVSVMNQRRHSSTDAESRQLDRKKRPEDFVFGKVIGEGSYSTVFLAKELATDKEYAIKVLEKLLVIKEKKAAAVKQERDVMSMLNHPYFVRLYFTFQDPERLFFALSYARHGDMLQYINKLECFDEQCRKFYSAEIILALEYLHGKNIIHRDLKPENILLNEEMHIQICDFGSAKILADLEPVQSDDEEATSSESSQRKSSFVGSAQFVSPEVLRAKTATYSIDLWALGCIVYQLTSGQLPFWGNHEYGIFQKILALEYEFPNAFQKNAKDLVQNLLIIKPKLRLGSKETGGYEKLKSHAFFEGISWDSLPSQTPPTLQPYLPAIDEQSTDFYSNLKPGFDPKQIDQLVIDPIFKGNVELEEEDPKTPPKPQPVKRETWLEKVMPRNDVMRSIRLREQSKTNEYHRFVDNHVILHQGLLDKRKGLFARKRMFLLCEGPRLYYVDPKEKTLKGQIPWSKDLKPECKDFKIFFVHTPNRVYYLEDRYERNSLDWCQKILDVYEYYYESDKTPED